jgi:pantetheine-phosphate adenylyltransferase
MRRRFEMVGVSGTFDMLHKGHRTLISRAFEVSEYVIIGLCSDEFVTRMRKSHITAKYTERLKELSSFLSEKGLLKRAKIIPIDDVYGGVTTIDSQVEALVVSEETESAAVKINEKRKEAGLHQLEIFVVEMVLSDNHSPISTTEIRLGEVDQEGHIVRNRKN